MSAFCRSCGIKKSRHGRDRLGRICPVRKATAEERVDRDLPPVEVDDDTYPPLLVVDRSLLPREGAA